MRILWLLFVLAFVTPVWAGDPQPAGQAEPVPNSVPEEPLPPPPSDSPDLSKARQRLREMDRRLSVLESAVVGRGHGRGVMERGLGWSPAQEERGFALYSTDGLYRLHLNGGIQVDYHSYPMGRNANDPGTTQDGFELRRLRPILDFRIGQIRGQIMPDLASKFQLFNAFIDFEAAEWARMRVGLFKSVMNIENQQGEFDLVFAERSFVQNFALRRDYGVQLTGRVFQQSVRYDFGVFNSNSGAIGNNSRPLPAAENDKLGMARLMYTPFVRMGPQALRKLDVGVGTSFGTCEQTSCQQPMETMGFDRTIFQYNGTVTGNGFEMKVLPQMSWFWSRVGVMSTFIHTWEPKIDRATGKSATLQHEAWMAQGEVALTDDEPAFNRVIPKLPFDLSKPGHWGAWTIGARYSEQRLDPETFGLNFGNATQFAQTAKGYSAALNWYASREFRFQGIWEHTEFKGATPAYAAGKTSDFFILRVTLVF